MACVWVRPFRGLVMGSVLLGSSVALGEEPEKAEPAQPAPKKVDAPAAQASGAAPGKAPEVVQTREEGEEGVKTYEFGTVEVEGRLRSPQIIYFLRRVRAEFQGEGLGHRSFMLELKDTRRHAAFR